MADLIIKPATGDGNKLILQDKAGGAVLTTADAGATITSATIPTITGNVTITGDLVPSTPMSHRNMIINGGMQVAQRGTVTVTGSSYGGPDRFTSFISAAGTWEQSQHNMTSAELNTTGFSSAYKMKCTVANASIGAAGYAILGQRLEAQNLQHLKWGTASAKDMTLSFWVRSAKTGTHVIQLFHDEATGYNSIAYTIAVADTWEYKTMTFSGHPSIAIDNNNGTGFRVYFWLDAGSNLTSGTLTNNTWHTTVANRAAGQATLADTVNNEFYITGVQLELGSSATPFEHRSYGEELARCMRYYINSKSIAGSNDKYLMPIVRYHPYSKATNYWSWASAQFPVVMRTTPNTKGCFDTSGTDGKIMYWTNQSGSNSDNYSPHTVEAGPMHIVVTVYADSNYGFAANYWADAEL